MQLDDRYLDVPTLQRIVAAADVVLLPYDSPDQVTSGVLTEAVVAGKPVVSTAFPHAVELLSGGAGLLVPRRDPAAIRAALRRVLTEPGLAASDGCRVPWPRARAAVVRGRRQYVDLGAGLLTRRSVVGRLMYPSPVFDHLAHLSTPIGLFEHALLDEPRPSTATASTTSPAVSS